MSPVRRPCVLGGLVLVGFFTPAAYSAEIDHKAVGCVVAEQFPRLEARLTPADAVGRARVFFSTGNRPVWYAVAMKRDGEVFAAALPKPKKSLKQFRYYLEVADTAMATSRTEEYATNVVSGAGGCAKGMMAGVMSAASILLEVPAGAAAIPVGFSSAGVVAAGSTATVAGGGAAASSGGGGLGTGAIVGGLGAVAAAGAVVAVKAAGGGGKPVDISGQVFARFGPNPANPSGPGLYSNPVVGGVVSTSLDSTTATTDGEGRFRLVTQSDVSSDAAQCYTITITASGLPTYSVTGGWGQQPSNQTFSLVPPQPATIGPCRGN
jgi:hypothetical protein